MTGRSDTTMLQDQPWKRGIEKEVAAIRWTQQLHTWLLATNIALTGAVLFKLLMS